jgi:hypothetical protein
MQKSVKIIFSRESERHKPWLNNANGVPKLPKVARHAIRVYWKWAP